MGILSRTVFREIFASALLGTILFTFVLFLQRLSGLFELMVRSSASFATIGYLFTLVMPYVLTFTVPVGVLVGVLIGLSRMSSDGEITAMRASGVPGRKLIGPILSFAALGAVLAAAASLWLTPLSIRETYRLLNRMAAAQLTAAIQPRVFEEQFPRTVLYVGDVLPTRPVRWRRVFLADLTPPEERQTGARENAKGPRITVAAEAIANPDLENNRIQLTLLGQSSHEAAKNTTEYFISSFPRGDQLLEAGKRDELRARAFRAMDTGPLYLESRNSVDARIELHQRLALPPACILLALVGIPIGMSSRKGGRSAAFAMTVLIAFTYFTALIGLIGLARQGTLPVGVAVWIPNVMFGIAGLVLLLRLELPGERDLLGRARQSIIAGWNRLRGSFRPASSPLGSGPRRFLLLPVVIDAYVLTAFFYYFVVLLASFVVMAHVYVFFDVLDEIIKNKIAMSRVGTYLFFLTPKLIYDSTPMSVLVATLVTFGILSKHNEVIALKACGVSLHRLAVPILLASAGISAALFGFDHYYVPEANRIQDGILNEIKGRPAQTFLRPDRKWIFGKGSRIYYYTYFDPNEDVMHGVDVYELDPEPFRLKRHISAERARWEPSLKTWVFQNGWTRDIQGIRVMNFKNFQGQTMSFPELDEPPSYFLQEVKQAKQMNFIELERYMGELKQSGLDVTRLQVQFHKKFSVPLFALIMAAIAVPFAFLAGGKGAMASVGASFSIAIAYISISQLFEQFGNVNQLPATLAAWSPDVLFGMAGLYLLFQMRT